MTTSYTTYYLPISYSESHIAILGQEQERNKGLGLSPEGLNGYIAAISYSGDTQNIRYLSIGYQQWGTEPGVGTYEYPIPYTSLCYGVITNRQVQKSNNATTAVDITLTEFTCSKSDGMGDYTFNWFSAGIQQWGLSTGRTITYPISLLTLYSIVALDAASGMDAVQVCDVNTADNTNAIIFQMRLTQGDILPDNMTGFYWILIGRVQQWGFHNGSGNNIITLLLPYKSCYTPLASSTDTYSGNLPYVLPVGSRQNAALSKLDISSAASSCYWLTIGYQQWGTVLASRGNFTADLNVPYLNFYLPYASSTNTYGTDIWTVSARVETDLSKIGLSSEGNFEIIWLAIGM